MKKVFVAIFAFIGWATYANNATVDVMETLNVLEENEVILVVESEEKKEESFKEENEVAFEYYYTMDWLYEKTPFIYKLEVLV